MAAPATDPWVLAAAATLLALCVGAAVAARTQQRQRQRQRHWLVLVLGDLGHSPRMSLHALSLAARRRPTAGALAANWRQTQPTTNKPPPTQASPTSSATTEAAWPTPWRRIPASRYIESNRRRK
ncbi:hypothetical protein BDR26DRAFT_170585 [Obelidium mucronatum]|nr:hypothetical protein BDR26DRAFT_170585 [Obelidium mucronatum]